MIREERRGEKAAFVSGRVVLEVTGSEDDLPAVAAAAAAVSVAVALVGSKLYLSALTAVSESG